jgi:hypothetical protein
MNVLIIIFIPYVRATAGESSTWPISMHLQQPTIQRKLEKTGKYAHWCSKSILPD